MIGGTGAPIEEEKRYGARSTYELSYLLPLGPWVNTRPN